jgi:hypothetical protein
MKLHVKAVEALDMEAMDTNGLCDPYVKLYLSSAKKSPKKTSVVEKSLHPVWDEIFTFDVGDCAAGTTLHISLYDKDLTVDDKISDIDVPFQDLNVGQVSKQWLDLRPVKGVTNGGRLHIWFHLATAGASPFVEAARAPPAPITDMRKSDVADTGPISPNANTSVNIITFVKDALHPEFDGMRLAEGIARALRPLHFRSVTQISVGSRIADLDAALARFDDPKALVVIVLSNDCTSKIKLIAEAFNATNFVVPDLDGRQLLGQPIFPDIAPGAKIENPIDFRPIVKKLAPLVAFGKDADLFLANYIYAKGIKAAGNTIGGIVRFSTPAMTALSIREQVRAIIPVVEYIVGLPQFT